MTGQKIAGFVANLGRKPSLLNVDPAQGLTISIELEGAEPVDVVIRTLQEKELVDFIYRAAAQSLPIYLETREGRLLQAKVPYSGLANATEGEYGDFEVSIGISPARLFLRHGAPGRDEMLPNFDVLPHERPSNVRQSTRFNGHIVRVGLNYHFNWWWGAGPVVEAIPFGD